MKKLISLLLVSVMLLMCAFAAYAEDAQEASPYGIPLYASAQDVDLEAVLEANSFSSLLRKLDNVRVCYHKCQVDARNTTDDVCEDTYYHDGDLYVYIATINQDQYIEYKDSDPNDEYRYVSYKYREGEKFKMNASYFKSTVLKNNVTPFKKGTNFVTVTNAEE